MTSPKRQASTRKERKLATRKAIREVAAQVFAQNGFDGTTAGDIAKAAGVAHGTFYVHFANKEAVADELLADFNDGFVTRLEPVLHGLQQRPMAATVRAIAGHFIDHWQAERSFVRVYAQRTASGLHLEALRDGVNPPMVALLRPMIEAAATATAAHGTHAGLITHGLLGLWLRIGLQHALGEAGERDEAVDTLSLLTIGALGSVMPGLVDGSWLDQQATGEDNDDA